MVHIKVGGYHMSNLIKKLFLLLIFTPTFLFAAPIITVNNPSSDVSTENAVTFDVSIVDSLSTYGFVDWDDSLVGWWRAEGNANDESKSGNHGEFIGNASTTGGRFGQAFEFNGSGDYVDLGDEEEFDFHKTDSFTISLWVKKPNDLLNYPIRKISAYGMACFSTSGWVFLVGGKQARATGDTKEWVHLVGTYDGSTETLTAYTNGVDATNWREGSIAGDISTADTLKISTGEMLVDEVMIFNRALSPEEIKSLYEVTNGKYINTFSDLTEFTTHSYQFYAVNTNGEMSNTEKKEILIDVPNTPPRVVLNYPLNNSRVDTSEQTFKCTVSNTNRNTKIQSVTFYWDYHGSFIAGETKQVSGDTVSVEFTKTNLVGKTFHWNCYARDTGGNSGFAPENYTFTVGRDVYYVATNGNDANPGTLAKPFRTIQKAADITLSGDTIYIRAGVYRETVTPKNSGVSFKGYPGEVATISGADIVSGPWTLDKGSIYKTTMNWDMGKGNNQIFVDGKAMMEARWPDADDVMKPNWSLIKSYSYDGTMRTATINDDSNLTQPAGFWNGAIFHGAWSYTANTGIVSSYSPGTLTVTLHTPAGHTYNMPGSPYYLIGSYNALDKATEWHYDNSTSTLYLWAPYDSNPQDHTIEAKRRRQAFNLSGKSYINIEGINIFAANITTDPNSHHITIDNMDAKYVTHYWVLGKGPGGETGETDSGIILDGHNNILKNSVVKYSAGNGVSLIGNNNIIQNCEIGNVNYAVSECAAISTGYNTKTQNNKIINNTLYNAGRSILLHNTAQNIKILHNEMYNNVYGGEVWDLGATYVIATDGKGSEIAYNRIHDVYYIGIYLDYSSNNFNIHHNVIWDMKGDNWRYGGSPHGIHMNTPSQGNNIYHNTLGNCWLSINASWQPSLMYGTNIKNNVGDWIAATTGAVEGLVAESNINTRPSLGSGFPWYTKDPETVYVDYQNNDYRLRAGSPAIDAGVDVGFTHDILGNPIVNAPDIGAYEYVLFPVSAIKNEPKEGRAPLTVSFDGSQSTSPNGNIVSYAWDFGDGSTSTEMKTSHIFTSPGEYTVTLTVTDVYGVKDESQIFITVFPKEFAELPAGCYNNVFNPVKGEKALIVVELPKQARVRVNLYNTRGNKIRELADEEKEAGSHKYYWDGKSGNGDVVGSGLYFVHIQAGDYKKTKKIVVVK